MKNRAFVIFCFMFMSVLCFAQYEGTTLADRLGDNEKVMYTYNNFVKMRQLYNDFRTDETYPVDTVYETWRRLFDVKPFASTSVPIIGITMLDSLIVRAEDPAVKMSYLDELLDLYNFRVDSLAAYNSIPGEGRQNVLKSDILIHKAYDYHMLAKQVFGYSPVTARQFYIDAFDATKNESLTEESEIAPHHLENYFTACEELYQADKEQNLEQFLLDYEDCVNTCRRIIDARNDEKYVHCLRYTEYNFYMSGARDSLPAYFQRKLVGHEKDIEELNHAVKVMFANECVGNPVFLDVCEKAYFIKPTYESCIGMALLSLQDQDRDGAREFLSEASNLAESAYEKYLVAVYSGMAIGGTPQPDLTIYETNAEKNNALDRWRGVLRGAVVSYENALEYASQTDVPREKLATVYFNLAVLERKVMEFGKAEQYIAFVKQFDNNYNQENIDNEIANITKAHNDKIERDKRYQAQLNNKRAWDAYNKAQAEAAAKRKAEEDFWKGR